MLTQTTPITLLADGSFRIEWQEDFLIGSDAPLITLLDGTVLTPAKATLQTDQNSVVYEYPEVGELTMGLEALQEGYVRIVAKYQNLGQSPQNIDRIVLFQLKELKTPRAFERVLVNGPQMADFTFLHNLDGNYRSHGSTGFTDGAGSTALVMGFEDFSDSFSDFTIESDSRNLRKLEAVVQREGVPVAASDCLPLPALLIYAGESLSTLTDKYAQRVGEVMNAINVPIQAGWCSWYYYYGTETEQDILDNVKAMQDRGLSDLVRVVQIDDGWNIPTEGHPRVWGDWEAGYKFADGMRSTADRIKAAGFVPGLWLAPFSVDPDSQLFKQRPDLLTSDDDGPKKEWGCYGLDLTNPAAIQFVEETFDRVFNQWGFDYIKIDFLMHGIIPGRKHNPNMTSAQAYRLALQTIRKVAGNRFVLFCGGMMGPSVGLCDGCRIGYDVSSLWGLPVKHGSWLEGNCCIKAAAIQSIWRQWMHGRWWQNDPDCLVVRDYGTSAEINMLGNVGLVPADAENLFGLTEEEALGWVRLVWMLGAMTLISENICELDQARLDLLKHAFPINPAPARWLDDYRNRDLVFLRSDGETLNVGIFNFGEQSYTPALAADKLGVSRWNFRERITGETFSGEGSEIEFPVLAPHAGRIWELVS